MDQVKLLSRISGGLGCDLVNQTTEFTARLGRIYVIIPDEANSRILNMTEERPPNAPSSVKTTAVVTGGTYKSVQRVDYITLAGTGGTATIVCNGVTKTATFATDLTVTASNFVTANATDYLASGVVLTSLLNVLIFTAVLAGTDFTGASSGANVSGDLAGTATTPVANVTKNLKENRLIIPDYPLTKFTPSAGSFWVYYEL